MNFKELLKRFYEGLKRVFKIMRPSLIAIAIGLFIGFIVMLIFNPSGALPGLVTMMIGGFNTGFKGFGDVLLKAAPIILTGAALVVAFKTGLFNIGASGQMILGAYVAIHVGVLWPIPAPFHWMVALILGTIAGAIWAMIPGLLKAFTNTNEVVSSIMMNYIGTFLVVYLVKTYVYNPLYSKSTNVLESAALPKFGGIFGTSSVNIGLIIAILAVVVVHIIFKKTTLGYELKSSGFNMDASKYAGMNAKRNIVVSMAISGALAGLAGAIQYLVIGTNLSVTYTILQEGFDGISVALLGLIEPIGSLFAGVFLSHIRQGGFNMQINGFPTEIIDIIISIIVYATSISIGLQLIYKRFIQKRKEKKALKESEVK